jgi:hypothetical protein
LLTLPPRPTGPSPLIFSQFPATLHHDHTLQGLHESNEFHDSHNHHGFTILQHSSRHLSFPQTLYNNASPKRLNPSSHYYQPSQNITPSATQAVLSPSTGRKRKNKSGRGGAGCKRQRQPAPIIAAPASTICGVGPPSAIPTDPRPNLSDHDPPSSSPQLPTITVQTVQPPVNSKSFPAPSASTQLSPPCIRHSEQIGNL